MPRFKTNTDIFKTPTEYFNENWMDTPFLQTPQYKKWDYKTELKIENINLWEVLYEGGFGHGVYAAWDPYAEFYLLNYFLKGWQSETFYGRLAQNNLKKRIKNLNLDFVLPNWKIWIDPEDMWLYSK